MYLSTKTFEHAFSAAFRQWRADSHCRFLHGYALTIRIKFAANSLDKNNWVIDFGSMKDLKTTFEDTFDHKTLVAQDDPLLFLFERMHKEGAIDMVRVPKTGCEFFTLLAFDITREWLRKHGHISRVHIHSIEVMEHGGNSAIYKE